MQEAEKVTKKWLDYSDQSEQEPTIDPEHHKKKTHTHHHHEHQETSTKNQVDHKSKQFITEQTQLLAKAKVRSEEIWVVLESKDFDVLKKKVGRMREEENPDILSVYKSKDFDKAWDVKAKAELVSKWISSGFDSDWVIKVTIAPRNFPRRNQERNENGEERPERRQRRDNREGYDNREDRRGRGRGDRRGGDRQHRGGGGRERRDREKQGGKKPVYVDKQTGKAPDNKASTEHRIMQEKQRQYSKVEAEKKGLQLGNFRNKPKPVEPVFMPEEVKQQEDYQNKNNKQPDNQDKKITKFSNQSEGKPRVKKEYVKLDENQSRNPPAKKQNIVEKQEEVPVVQKNFNQEKEQPKKKYVQRKEGDEGKKAKYAQKGSKEEKPQNEENKLKKQSKNQQLLSEDSN